MFLHIKLIFTLNSHVGVFIFQTILVTKKIRKTKLIDSASHKLYST